jgi:hypothetical protein
MRSRTSPLLVSLLLVTLFAFTLCAAARDVVLPAGTLLKCTLNEPNFSSKTAEVGDPVVCHLHGVVEFGQQAFPRGSYLVGHLEADKDPGHFVGKGYLKLQFDRIGLPTGDLPLEAKVVATNGYKVDKEGKIDGKGHAKRDVIEWMFPPLWPWKVIMLPARGPRPTLKNETALTLRLMDDVEIPQLAQTFGPDWHFFGSPTSGPQNSSFHDVYGNPIASNAAQVSGMPAGGQPQLAVRQVAPARQISAQPQITYASYISHDPLPVIPSGTLTLPGMPVFVLTTGTLLSVSAYGYQDNRITYTLASGGTGVITSDQVDWNSTTRLNAQRGVRVTLHTGHTNPGTQGM